MLERSKARILATKSLSKSFLIRTQRTSSTPRSTATASSTWQTTAGGLRKERSSARSLKLTAAAAVCTVTPASQSDALHGLEGASGGGGAPAPSTPGVGCAGCLSIGCRCFFSMALAGTPGTSPPAAGTVFADSPRVRGRSGCTGSASVSSATPPPSWPRIWGLSSRATPKPSASTPPLLALRCRRPLSWAAGPSSGAGASRGRG
mmetsp:Transcript_15424/g.48473  ORF Transcript_15424/g.48473 Transcript_15424/m.48473 type:complete len:205 (-) Transcript_15424:789-1403(-)